MTPIDLPTFDKLMNPTIQVEVTGKSGDGGIDGKGITRLGGLC